MIKTQVSNNIKKMSKQFLPTFDTRTVVFMGMFISLSIVFTRFVSIETPILRIGFGFLPIAMASIILGPIAGGLVAALADIIGLVVASKVNLFFPGFTLSAFLSGMVYGVLLYRKPQKLFRVSLCVLFISVFIDLGLNTLWLQIISGIPFFILLIERLVPNLLMMPVKILMIQAVWRCLSVFIKHNYFRQGYSS